MCPQARVFGSHQAAPDWICPNDLCCALRNCFGLRVGGIPALPAAAPPTPHPPAVVRSSGCRLAQLNAANSRAVGRARARADSEEVRKPQAKGASAQGPRVTRLLAQSLRRDPSVRRMTAPRRRPTAETGAPRFHEVQDRNPWGGDPRSSRSTRRHCEPNPTDC